MIDNTLVRRIGTTAITLVLAMAFNISDVLAASTAPVEKKPQEPGQKQIEYSASKLLNERRARELKKTGDFNFDQNDPELAANFYLRALALAPGAFTVKEKKIIADRLVTANRQREAIEVLRQLALEQGDDAEIRISLAKLFSANEDYAAAIAEVDQVLEQDRGNRYALLVKANSLRSQQKFGQSIYLYRRILEQGEDFDAHLGLTYSLLAEGEKKRARESFGRMKAEDQEQQSQINDLAYFLDSATRPTVDLYSGTFTDSEKNKTSERRVTVRGAGTDWDLAASIGKKAALSEGVTYAADAVTGSASTNFSEVLRLTLKLGQVKLGADQLRTVATRDVEVDFKVGLHPVSIVNVDISHDVITTTGAQIGYATEQDQSSVKLTRALDAATMLYLTYRYRQYDDVYSDVNSANDFQGTVQRTVISGGPVVRVGYTYRQMDYRYPSYGGYFAPQNYKSHQGYVTLYYEYGSYYFDSEVDYGRQMYVQGFYLDPNYDDPIFSKISQPFTYASATVGTTVAKKFRLELHAEYNKSGATSNGNLYHDLLANAQASYMF